MRREQLSLRVIVVAIGAIAWQDALSNPTGPTVITGVGPGGITGLGTATVNVTTNAAKSIIEWQGFSIGSGELTRFTQPSASAAALNRVTSTGPSSILGSLQSNGRVFLINPNGITFGAGSTVDVAGLVASSLNLTNDNFLAGKLSFSGGGLGPVANEGTITTTGANAPVYLIGPSVANARFITSPQGEVILAAGSMVNVVNPGTPDVTVQINSGPSNLASNVVEIVANSGRINMFGGSVQQNSHLIATGERGKITIASSGNVEFGVDSLTRSSGPITVTAGDNVTLNPTSGRIGASIESEQGPISITASTGSIEMGPGSAGLGSRITSSTGDISLSAKFNIGLTAFPGGAGASRIETGGNVSLKGQIIGEGPSAGVTADDLTVEASGPSVALFGSNSVASFFASNPNGPIGLFNASPTLTIRGVSTAESFVLRQTGNLTINGDVTAPLSVYNNIQATGNILITPAGDSGLTVRTSGPIQAGGDMKIQGGNSRGEFALLTSPGNIDVTVGGTLRLNSGSVPQAWARVQTENRASMITLHFPNLSSGGWFVNGEPGAIRQGQSGFLSGNGAAVLGKTLITDYGQ